MNRRHLDLLNLRYEQHLKQDRNMNFLGFCVYRPPYISRLNSVVWFYTRDVLLPHEEIKKREDKRPNSVRDQDCKYVDYAPFCWPVPFRKRR